MNNLKNFYCIEGIDGSGKTSLAKSLNEKLNNLNIKSEYTFEPTNSEIGNLIRRYLKKEIKLSNESLVYLFAADRHNHLYGKNGLVKKCKNTKVISDRYLFSSIAYQSLDNNFDFVLNINENFFLPEKLFYINIDPEDALERINERSDDKEIFDDLLKLNSIKNNYWYCLNYFKYKYQFELIELDGNKSIEDLTKECLGYIIE
jgi:dTMP kinase